MAIRRKKNSRKGKVSKGAFSLGNGLLRGVGAVLVVVVFVVAMTLFVRAFFYKSDYFRLGVVQTRAAFLDEKAAEAMNNQIVNLYKGRNVFNIPLKSIAHAIRSNYTDVRDVEVKIALPDKLLIDLKLRRPVAFVRSSKIYPIDEDGVVLPAVQRTKQLKDLPFIDGVEVGYKQRNPSKNLKLALELLKKIRQARFMTEYGVSEINASNPQNMSFYMNNGVQVKIGPENLDKRLAALERTLKDPRLVIDKIAYIDVRFKDVVIGPK